MAAMKNMIDKIEGLVKNEQKSRKRSDVVLAEVGRGGDGGVDSARNVIRLVHEGITCTFVFEVIEPLRSG